MPAVLPEVSLTLLDRVASEDVERPASVPPPAPWTSWEQVARCRSLLKTYTYTFTRPDAKLTDEQRQEMDEVIQSPVGSDLTVVREFLGYWYGLCRDEKGQRRNCAAAKERFERLRKWKLAHDYPSLRAIQRKLTPAYFKRISAFLAQPAWEATSNGAERTGRQFRHVQGRHFNLRTDAAIEGVLKAGALQKKTAMEPSIRPQVARYSRGRRPRENPQETSRTVA